MSSYGGRGPTLNAVLWCETLVGAAFVAARFYTRIHILHSAGLDDLCLFLTLFLLLMYSIFLSAGTAYGIGQKAVDIASPSDYSNAMMYELIAQGFCIFNIAASKASVGFLLLRIVTKMWQKLFIWFLIVSNTISATFLTIAIFIQCLPTESLWNTNVKGNCWLDFTTAGIIVSAYAVGVDFLLALMPCFIVWDLQMKKKDKITTAAGLGLGVFAGVCGIFRTINLSSMRSIDDYLYDTVDMLIYSGTENFVSALCASIPVIRPLWSKIVHGYASRSGSYPSKTYVLSDMNGSRDAERALGAKGGIETRIYANDLRRVDNTSEEMILHQQPSDQQSKEDDQIYMQTDISVKSSQGNRTQMY